MQLLLIKLASDMYVSVKNYIFETIILIRVLILVTYTYK